MYINQAGPVSFLRTILIILLIYYAFKFLTRYIFPLFFKKMVDNIEKKVREQQSDNSNNQQVKEGETVIDQKPTQSKPADDDVGEYIDYEEIE